jgi:hypothetical protein
MLQWNRNDGKTKAGFLCPIGWKNSEREPFCRPLETEFSSNILGGSRPFRKQNGRMWANEIHVQVPKHSEQFPRVIGSWLRGVFHPAHNESNSSNLPLRVVSRESTGPDSFSGSALVLYPGIARDLSLARDFIRTLSSSTTLKRYLSRCKLPARTMTFFPGSR